MGMKSTLKCPKCGALQEGDIPDTSCIPFYVCDSCHETIAATNNDCCVFCSHGTEPCPVSNKH